METGDRTIMPYAGVGVPKVRRLRPHDEPVVWAASLVQLALFLGVSIVFWAGSYIHVDGGLELLLSAGAIFLIFVISVYVVVYVLLLILDRGPRSIAIWVAIGVTISVWLALYAYLRIAMANYLLS